MFSEIGGSGSKQGGRNGACAAGVRALSGARRKQTRRRPCPCPCPGAAARSMARERAGLLAAGLVVLMAGEWTGAVLCLLALNPLRFFVYHIHTCVRLDIGFMT